MKNRVRDNESRLEHERGRQTQNCVTEDKIRKVGVQKAIWIRVRVVKRRAKGKGCGEWGLHMKYIKVNSKISKNNS